MSNDRLDSAYARLAAEVTKRKADVAQALRMMQEPCPGPAARPAEEVLEELEAARNERVEQLEAEVSRLKEALQALEHTVGVLEYAFDDLRRD